MRVLDHISWFHRLVFMVQKEVADRLLAAAGSRERGLLTVLLEAYCEVTPVGTVSASCFYPQPKIASSILSCAVRRPSLVSPEETLSLRTVVKAAFSTRRKTILNALTGASGLGLSKESTVKLLEEAGIAPTARAEAVATEQFLALVGALKSVQPTH
jgi:16S rRNA (adenine1518-N6/adenine1519-N6)-dimethyltransferase